MGYNPNKCKITKTIAKERVEYLKRSIRYFNRRYYIENESDISDEHYDSLMRELENLEKRYKSLRTPDSPTQVVLDEDLLL